MADRLVKTQQRRWHRFSLRTLIIFALLIGSVMMLWRNSPSWLVQRTFEGSNRTTFSADSRLMAVEADKIRIYDIATDRVVHELENFSESDLVYFDFEFSEDGKWFAVCESSNIRWSPRSYFWRTSDWSLVHKMRGWEFDRRSGRFCMVGGMRFDSEGPVFEVRDALPDELRIPWLSHWADNTFMTFDFSYDDKHCAKLRENCSGAIVYLPGDLYDAQDWKISPDGRKLATSCYLKTVLWTQRRPMQWWGIAWLWEFWLTIALAGAFIWSVLRSELPGAVFSSAPQ